MKTNTIPPTIGQGSFLPAALALSLLLATDNRAASVNFQLLTWGDANATLELPSGAGLKPSASNPAAGDWLVFTGDDQNPGSTYNPSGALSHNFADLGGLGGSGFNNAPSLTGSIAMDFTAAGANAWNLSVTGMSYTGQATPMMFMNQFLVTPGSPATAFNVDGLGNSGTWNSSTVGNWAIQYDLDFYFATNADGNPAAGDVDATFNNKTQTGYLLPTALLTPAGLATLALNDPAGFFGGDFENYLLDEVAPRLPEDATYLLFSQMDKVNPGYAESGLPFSTSSLIGNTTFAYTTAAIPEPASAMLVLAGTIGTCLTRRRRQASIPPSFNSNH